MNTEIVAIGSELLLGQTVDTNSAWIANELASVGVNCFLQTSVGDNHARLVEVFEAALERSDAVICCGGLGPTHDDITRQAIAAVMGVELVRDEVLVKKIAAMFDRRGREMSQSNLSQAMVPLGAHPIAQQPGTAAGLVCPVGSKVIYAVPGVPREMKEMVSGTIIAELLERSGRKAVIKSRLIRTWGVAESTLGEMLDGKIRELEQAGNPTLALLASGVEGLKIRVTAKAETEAEAINMLDVQEAELRDIVGDLMFAIDDNNMESTVIELLKQNNLTLGLAESLTGGYVTGRLCSVPGASSVVKGGVVAYQNEVKTRLLGVSEDQVANGVVSENVAKAMAQGARQLLGVDVAIATTGLAGPAGAEGKPVGTVCLAISGPFGDYSATQVFGGNREQVRQLSTITVLNMLRLALSGRKV